MAIITGDMTNSKPIIEVPDMSKRLSDLRAKRQSILEGDINGDDLSRVPSSPAPRPKRLR